MTCNARAVSGAHSLKATLDPGSLEETNLTIKGKLKAAPISTNRPLAVQIFGDEFCETFYNHWLDTSD